MIIALNGLKQSGKTTAAEYLIEEYGFEPVSFAQPLKDSLAALFGVSVEDLESVKDDPLAYVSLMIPPIGLKDVQQVRLSIRELMQRYGTEAHRDIPEFGRNVWSDMAEDKLAGGGNYVIADCRFDNEAVVIHRCDGLILHLVRDSVVVGDEHESESGLSEGYIDFDVDNNGYVEDLYRRLDEILAAGGN